MKEIKEENNKIKIFYYIFPLFAFYFLDYILVTYLSVFLDRVGIDIYSSAVKLVYIIKTIIITPVIIIVLIRVKKD